MLVYSMIKEEQLCVECIQVITDPICPKCLSKHTIYWLKDKEIRGERLLKISKRLFSLKIRFTKTATHNKCVICNSKEATLCLFCFIRKITKIIEKNANEKISTEFKKDFNPTFWSINPFGEYN